MQILRMFSNDKYKGTRNYLNTQKKYEVLRTLLYFFISISLFVSGMLLVKSKANLLTIVAILGCLPASKSAVTMVMYLRYKSCSEKAAQQIEQSIGELHGLYDMVFTSYDKNFPVSHLTVKGNTVCGYTESTSFDEQAFSKHIDGILKADGYKNITVKIFSDLTKYTIRLKQLQESGTNPEEKEEQHTEALLSVLKSVSL